MILTLLITLSLTVSAQEISNGTNFFPNRAVANHAYPDCVVADSMHTFYNLRIDQCSLNFPTFRNGEIRLLQKSVIGAVFPQDEQITYGVFGETSCAASQNAMLIRNFSSVEDPLSYYVNWDMTFIPRNPNNSLNGDLKIQAKWQKCRIWKSVAQTGCILFDGTRCDTGAPKTPIVLDLNNDGVVEMTTKAGGVEFDLDFNDHREQLPWLANGDDGWLVLAYNSNGLIEDGRQFFGPGDKNNGYLHLAGFDDDKDGKIDASDGVWNLLGAWRDVNHNGVSEPGEVVLLGYLGIKSISLDFKESRRKDRHGNEFRYRSKMKFEDGRDGHTFDVILSAK